MSDEAHFPAEQSGPQAAARVPRPHGDGRRPQGAERAPRTRPQEAQRLDPVSPGHWPRDGAEFAKRIGARKERWSSIVTDEQRLIGAKAARRFAVTLGIGLDRVATLARATSPRCT